MDETTQRALQTAFQLLKSGKKEAAFSLLSSLVKSDPNSAEAWYLLGFAMTDPEKRLYAFQQVLRIDPTNQAAQKQIARLLTPPPPPAPVPAQLSAAQPKFESATVPLTEPVSASAVKKQAAKPKKKKGLSPVAWIGIGTSVLCVLAIGTGIVFALSGSLGVTPLAIEPTPLQITPLPVQPTFTPMPTPEFALEFRVTACPFDVPLGKRVRCGVVSVPQDREKENSPLIDLPVVVYKSANQGATPLIYLQGGPGVESLDWSLAMFDDYVSPLLEKYDMVFFDPRGTGRSSPRLDCPELNDIYINSYFFVRSEEESFNLFLDAWGKCHERFLADGVDPGAFNTTQSAADVHDIAQALGYEKVNLLGISYGTRLALTIMRDYPEMINAVVIDSVVPMETSMFSRYSGDVQYVLDKMFDDCAASPRCNQAYPDLRKVFDGLIERFSQETVTIKAVDLNSGFVFDAQVNDVDMVSAIVAGLKTSELVPVVPKAIYDIEKGDYTFLTFAIGTVGGTYDTMSMGTYFATVCPEQVNVTTPAQMDAALEAAPVIKKLSLQSLFGATDRVFKLCQSWGARASKSQDSAPVKANIPTLILSGEYDPTTPVTTGQMVSDDLPNDYFYVIPGMGHAAAIGNDCAYGIMLDFLDDPSREPDSACLQKEAAFDFFLPYDGQQPVDVVSVNEPELLLRGVAPKGWKREVASSIYQRHAYLFDPTLVEFGAFYAPQSAVVEALQSSFEDRGFEQTPKKIAARSANDLNWTIYESKFNGEPVIFALTEGEYRGTIMLAMVVSAPERDAFYDGLFIPMLDALTPSN